MKHLYLNLSFLVQLKNTYEFTWYLVIIKMNSFIEYLTLNCIRKFFLFSFIEVTLNLYVYSFVAKFLKQIICKYKKYLIDESIIILVYIFIHRQN